MSVGAKRRDTPEMLLARAQRQARRLPPPSAPTSRDRGVDELAREALNDAVHKAQAAQDLFVET